jgi:acetylglutamate kinase
MVKKAINKANVLIEALPYIRNFFDKIVVIKFGGSAMKKEGLKSEFARDIVLMKYIGINPVIVHGGGPDISRIMDRMGLEVSFVNGLRVTNQETMEIVEMVLMGKINKEIVTLINLHGGKAVGISGKDGAFIRARKFRVASTDSSGNSEIDLGQVGEVESINTKIIESLDKDWFIPVIAPLAYGKDGSSYNVNADIVAGEVAAALKAEKLIYLTDMGGILNKNGERVSTLTQQDVEIMIQNKTIDQGMIPKVNACVKAIGQGVKKAHIIDGRIEHSLLLEIFTKEGIGSEIVQ